MVHTQVSPTGIETQAWIWVRAWQLVFATGAFVTGCVEARRFMFIFLLLFPVFLLTIWNTIDASVFYKNRYTRGAGAISILRTLNDWFILCILGVTCPFIFIGWSYPFYDHYSKAVIWTILGFVVTNMCFYFASAIMLCVEDARMRKSGRMMVPSATESMPSNGGLMYRGADVECYSKMDAVNSETATTLVNNMLRNGFTIKQLAIMGSRQTSATSSTHTPPHSPSSAMRTMPPLQTDSKRSSYGTAPPHYDM